MEVGVILDAGRVLVPNVVMVAPGWFPGSPSLIALSAFLIIGWPHVFACRLGAVVRQGSHMLYFSLYTIDTPSRIDDTVAHPKCLVRIISDPRALGTGTG